MLIFNNEIYIVHIYIYIHSLFKKYKYSVHSTKYIAASETHYGRKLLNFISELFHSSLFRSRHIFEILYGKVFVSVFPYSFSSWKNSLEIPPNIICSCSCVTKDHFLITNVAWLPTVVTLITALYYLASFLFFIISAVY